MPTNPPWLTWSRELQALAQTGLHYAQSPYDTQRYTRIAELAAEITAAHTTLPPADILKAFSMDEGYKTPKIDVRAAVFHHGQLLLVHEKADGLWTLPGGWADPDWPPAAMVEREVLEEAGLTVKARKLVALFNASRPGAFFHTYKLLFLCDYLSGTPTPSVETLAAAFFPLDALPPLSLDRTHPRHLAELAAHLADPTRPTYFE